MHRSDYYFRGSGDLEHGEGGAGISRRILEQFSAPAAIDKPQRAVGEEEDAGRQPGVQFFERNQIVFAHSFPCLGVLLYHGENSSNWLYQRRERAAVRLGYAIFKGALERCESLLQSSPGDLKFEGFCSLGQDDFHRLAESPKSCDLFYPAS